MFTTPLRLHSLDKKNPNNLSGHQIALVGAVTAIDIGVSQPHGSTSHLAALYATLGTASTTGPMTVTVSRVRGGVVAAIGTVSIAQDEFSGETDLVTDFGADDGLISTDQILVAVSAAGVLAIDLSVLLVEEIDS